MYNNSIEDGHLSLLSDCLHQLQSLLSEYLQVDLWLFNRIATSYEKYSKEIMKSIHFKLNQARAKISILNFSVSALEKKIIILNAKLRKENRSYGSLSPLIDKLDKASNELTLSINKDSQLNHDENSYGNLDTKQMNSSNYKDSKFILLEILHSMSMLSNPGEDLFKLNDKLIENEIKANNNANSDLSFENAILKHLSLEGNPELDDDLMITLKETQISTAKALLNRIK